MATTSQDQRRIDEYKDLMTSAFADFSGLERIELRVGLGGARELLRAGEPLLPEEIARAVDVPVERVEEILRRHAELGFVFFDGQGRVVGMWAVGGMDAGHHLEVEGRAAPTWCALDTLLLPLWWGASARVTSRDPVTDRTISFTIGPDGLADLTPADAVVSAYVPDGPITRDVRMSFCRFVNFFESEKAGRRWILHQDARRFRLLPVAVAFAWAREFVGSVFTHYRAPDAP